MQTARVLELADKHDSESCARKGVGVQVSPLALKKDKFSRRVGRVVMQRLAKP